MSTTELSARAEKAFSFAQEVSKQVLTLSTAVFGITLTFLKDIAGPKPDGTIYLEFGWCCFIGSVVCGVLVLMSLAGNLERSQTGSDSIYSPNIKIFAGGQIGLFLAGLLLTLVFGLVAS